MSPSVHSLYMTYNSCLCRDGKPLVLHATPDFTSLRLRSNQMFMKQNLLGPTAMTGQRNHGSKWYSWEWRQVLNNEFLDSIQVELRTKRENKTLKKSQIAKWFTLFLFGEKQYKMISRYFWDVVLKKVNEQITCTRPDTNHSHCWQPASLISSDLMKVNLNK